MTVNDKRCTASVFREFQNKIEIEISKRAFTWHVTFRSTNKCHAMRAATVDETILPVNPNNGIFYFIFTNTIIIIIIISITSVMVSRR